MLPDLSQSSQSPFHISDNRDDIKIGKAFVNKTAFIFVHYCPKETISNLWKTELKTQKGWNFVGVFF